MSLNIKSAEALELAQRLEGLAHTTDPDAKARELLAIGRRVKAAMSGAPMDHAEFLYDPYGAPK